MPSSVEPLKNCTCETLPPGSLALAVIAIVAGAAYVAPEAGAVIVTDGGWFEVEVDRTVMLLSLEVVRTPGRWLVMASPT